MNSSTLFKLKNNSERIMELRSRKNLQIAGCDVKTTAAIATANSQSPLLSLPQEIKNRIYDLTLGGNLLHMKRDLLKFERNIPLSTKGPIKNRRLTHQICSSKISEEQAHHDFNTENGSSLYVMDIELRHSGCRASKHKSFLAPVRMDINLLLVCRQVYNEAHFIPYSSNIFSFDTPRILRAFIHNRIQHGVDVNRAIRSLHLDLIDVRFNLHGWTQAFNAVTQHMTLLDIIYITVNEQLNWSHSPNAQQKKMAMRPLLDCLAILGKIPTKSVVIVVSDQFLSRAPDATLLWPPTRPITHRWTVDEKRQWVAEVKLAIEHMRCF